MTREQAFVSAFYAAHVARRTDRCEAWALCPILRAFIVSREGK